MQNPSSSFFNFTATENNWTSKRHFKARVGALDSFEAHYNFAANFSDKNEQTYDFFARFNPTDTLCSHYNFVADPFKLDTRYDFYAKFKVLEMEMVDGEEMTLELVRPTVIHKLLGASTRGVKAEIEGTHEFAAEGEKIVVVDYAENFTRLVELNVGIAKADVLTPIDERNSVVLNRPEKLQRKIEDAVAVDGSSEMRKPIESHAEIDKSDKLVVPIDRGTTIDAADSAVVPSDVTACVDAVISFDGRNEVNIEADSSLRFDGVDERETDIIKYEPAKPVVERLTEVESTILYKSGAITTDIETDAQLSKSEGKSIDLIVSDKAQPVSSLPVEVQTSDRLSADANVLTDLDLSAMFKVEHNHIAEIESIAETETASRFTASVERIQRANLEGGHIAEEVDNGNNASSEYSFIANVEGDEKAVLDVTNSAVVERLVSFDTKNAEYAAIEMTSAGVSKMIRNATTDEVELLQSHAERTASIESATSAMSHNSATVDAESSTALNLRQDVNTEPSTAARLELEQTHDTEVEQTIGYKSGAIDADVERLDAAGSSVERDATIEEGVQATSGVAMESSLETSDVATIQSRSRKTLLEGAGTLFKDQQPTSANVEQMQSASSAIRLDTITDTPVSGSVSRAAVADVSVDLTAGVDVSVTISIETPGCATVAKDGASAVVEDTSEAKTRRALTAEADGISAASSNVIVDTAIEHSEKLALNVELQTEVDASSKVEHLNALLSNIEGYAEYETGEIDADLETSERYERDGLTLNAEVDLIGKVTHKRTIQTALYKPKTADAITGRTAEVEKADKGRATQEITADIENAMTADRAVAEFIAEVELPIEAEKRLLDLISEIEQPIKSERKEVVRPSEIEKPSTAGRVKMIIDTEIERSLLHEKIKIVLDTTIEDRFTGAVFSEYLAEIEDAIIGQFPEVEDEEEKKKLVWLIMGRPSWLHRYWQRTTR